MWDIHRGEEVIAQWGHRNGVIGVSRNGLPSFAYKFLYSERKRRGRVGNAALLA